jgi:photosystem II stability/assembly factor-like uncharacterized protein/predicted esterase
MRTWIFCLLVAAGCSPPPTLQPDGGSDADMAKPAPCSGQAGDFHSVAFESGGETRYYFLHVPTSYQCDTAWSLLVDFHGTGAGEPTDPVEESWAFDEMIEAADSEHFIVVRPRSRYAELQGTNIFQWDINEGDPQKNLRFATELIADLKARYHIDDQRVYASGFSNGPSQALQFLAVDPPLVHGYMVVNGGLNAPLTRSGALAANAGRVYVTVGFRDYMWSTTRTLFSFLDKYGHPADQRWQRQSNTGHELYGWHYHEAFAWLDRGQRPAAGALTAGWTRDPAFTGSENLITLAHDPAGRLHVAGEGAIYRRDASGAWTRTAQLPAAAIPKHVNGLCFFDDGGGIAVGEGAIWTSTDGASWKAGTPVPEFGMQGFGASYLNGVACDGTHAVAAGVWAAASSVDEGSMWSEAAVPTGGGAGFVTTVRRAAHGTFVAAGYYDYLGRSTDGVHFTAVTPPVEIQWYNDVAPAGGDTWFAVGEKGTIVTSSDDGVTWTAQPAPTTEDLYAVAFADASRGMAVGAHGTALVTTDGGAHWTSANTGLDGYLGALTWLDGQTALVVGEAGTVLQYSMP